MKTAFRAAGLVLAMFLVVGCTADGEYEGLSDPQRLMIACESYASALTGLAVFKDDLSEGDVSKVNDAREVINPICIDGNYQDVRVALNRVEAEVLKLLIMKEKVNG